MHLKLWGNLSPQKWEVKTVELKKFFLLQFFWSWTVKFLSVIFGRLSYSFFTDVKSNLSVHWVYSMWHLAGFQWSKSIFKRNFRPQIDFLLLKRSIMKLIGFYQFSENWWHRSWWHFWSPTFTILAASTNIQNMSPSSKFSHQDPRIVANFKSPTLSRQHHDVTNITDKIKKEFECRRMIYSQMYKFIYNMWNIFL